MIEIILRYGASIALVCIPMVVLVVGAAISDRKHFEDG